MPIRDLLWNDWNEERIARHHVRPEELDEVCFGEFWELRAGGGKRALYGQTSSGRYLLVIGVPRSGGLFYPVSARDMTEAERRRFREHQRR